MNPPRMEGFKPFGIPMRELDSVYLLYEEFEGHPLRKDYPTMGEQPRIPLRNPEHDNA